MDEGEVREILAELHSLADQYPGNDAIISALLAGLRAARGWSSDSTSKAVVELRTLSARHPENIEVASSFADALRTLALTATNPFERTLESDQVRELVGELRALANRHPDSAEVSYGLAGGLRSLPVEGAAERREMVAQLCALADRHPDSAKIAADAAWEVQRLMNLEMYDIHEARRLVGVLSDLADRQYSDGGGQFDDRRVAVAILCSEGLANFTSIPDVRADEVHKVVVQLRELTGRHPEASRLAAMLAVGLFRLALVGGLKKSETMEVIDELGRIAVLDHGKFSFEPYRIAQQLYTLSVKEFVDIDGARAAVAELGHLLDRDPTHRDIARLYASGLYGLMNRADATQEDARKARFELGRLSLSHGDDLEIGKIVWLLDHR